MHGLPGRCGAKLSQAMSIHFNALDPISQTGGAGVLQNLDARGSLGI